MLLIYQSPFIDTHLTALSPTLNVSLYNNGLSMRTDLITLIVLSILARLNGIHNYVIFRSKVQYVARFNRECYEIF